MSKKIIDVIADDIAAPREKIMDELRVMVADAEDLLNATANQTGEVAAIARARIQESLKVVKKSLLSAEASVIEHTRQSAKVADNYVHENPWQSIGVAACAGVIVGMLIKRQ
ncbi:MAG: DUF883 family protein [Gallionella sp.]|nr:DUF883 family protein [Gallionella sp.]